MKKHFFLMFLCCFMFCFICPHLSGAPKKGFNLGVNVGLFPVAWYYGLNYEESIFGKDRRVFLFCGEVGYKFTERIGILGEYACGRETCSSEYEEIDISYSHSSQTVYSSTPIRMSLNLFIPVDDKFSAYIGLGLGYYKIKYESEWSWQLLSGSDSDSVTYKIKEIAPHANFGIESAVLKRLAIFGEVRLIVGKAKLDVKEEDYSSKQDIYFGGSEVKIGIRYYFKD